MACDIDLTSGEVFQDRIDVDLSGLMDVTLTRTYSSSSGAPGVLGIGWSHSLDRWLEVGDVGITVHVGADGTPYTWEELNEPGGARLHRDERAIRLEQPGGATEVYGSVQGSRWYLTQEQDAHGNAVRMAYEGGRLAAIHTPEGRRLAFSYTAMGLLARLTLEHTALKEAPLVLVRYAVDAQGDLVTVTDPRGFNEEYEYADHLLVRHVNRTGGATYYAYDAARRCRRSWQDGPRRARAVDFDPRRATTLLTDGLGRRTLQRLNEEGQVVEQVDALGRVIEVFYDEEGVYLGMADEEGMVGETETYDADTRELEEHDAGGGHSITAFDEQDHVVRVERAPGYEWHYAYDDRGNLVAVTNPDGGTSAFEHDDRGVITRAIDPEGYAVDAALSRTGDHLVVRDAVGLLEEKRFDAAGNLIVYRDAAGNPLVMEYEGPDVLKSERRSGGEVTRYAHDGEENPTAETDPLGNTLRFEHDAYGLLIAEVDPLGHRVRYEYDAEENLRLLTNKKGEEFEIRYDPLDEEAERRFFDGHTERYTCDARGRRRTIVDANGAVTALEYDEGDHLISRALPDGSVQTLEWDELGRVVTITEEPGDETREPRWASFAYDARDVVVREEHDAFAIEQAFDAAGRLIAVRDGWGGETQYEHGPRFMRSLTESGRTFEFDWDARGGFREIRYPNGLRQTFVLDAYCRLTERKMLAHSGAVLAQRSLRYDAADHVVGMSDTHVGVRTYQYDPLGRLISVLDDGGRTVEKYEYDPDDNVIGSRHGRQVIGSGDRVSASGGRRIEYDASGYRTRHVASDGTWDFGYDGDRQLTRVERDGGLVAEYAYDLLNRRVRKVTAAGATAYLYDRHAVRAERRGEVVTRYVYLPGTEIPIACYTGETWYYYAFDQLGSPTEAWNEAGESVARLSQDAFGAGRVVQGEATLPFAFPGQYADEETGLHYNIFRYYDPTTASYISPDPLSLHAAVNHYVYPRDPLTWCDPDALTPMSLVFECADTPKFSWSTDACAKWVARMKVQAMNRALKKRAGKKCCKCKRSKQREYYNKNCGGAAPATSQVDHFIELQMGGADKCCGNLVAVPTDTNNALGKSTGRMLAGLACNTVIPKGSKISTVGCSGGKCSKKDKKNYMKRPPKRDCEKPGPVC